MLTSPSLKLKRCKECLDTMATDFPDLEISSPVKIDGGVSQNNFVSQFIADISGKEIQRVAMPSHVTALGCAYFAGLGAGIWKSKQEIKSLQKFDRTFSPSLDEERADALMTTWRRAIERAAKWIVES